MNQKSESLAKTIRIFWQYIPKYRKKHFILLLLLSFIVSLVEIISIGFALPFISALTEPEKVYNHEMLYPLFLRFGFESSAEILFPITIIFVLAILTATIMRLVLLRVNTKLAFDTGIDISIDIYNKVLKQPYIFHTSKNSSDVINLIYNKVSEIIFYIVMQSIILITSGIMSLVIASMLLYFIPLSVVWVMLVFVVSYIFIIRLIKQRLKENSQIIANESTQIVKTVQEGLGGIRDILIDKTQENFTTSYKNSVQNLRNAQSENQIFSSTPKFLLEGIGLLFVAFFAYTLSTDNDKSISVIPILVGIVLSIQRLLPLMQQMFNAWSQIQSAQASLRDVNEYLNLKIPNELEQNNQKDNMNFNTDIKIKNLSFKYSIDSAEVLKSINLIIKKGSRIGFIGTTGSGKSTLLDILMGLLEPTAGKIYIDEQELNSYNMNAWQSYIAHVPQSIYLTDSTIAQNIAFGIGKDDIDQTLVRQCAKKAQIAEVIEQMSLGYETIVGERGIQLSGGQRQRLGIARALYKKAQVIILDEATSALDGSTESAVMEVFESLGSEVTLLMIAHRITTLKNCTDIVELKHGKLNRFLKYEDLKEYNEQA